MAGKTIEQLGPLDNGDFELSTAKLEIQPDGADFSGKISLIQLFTKDPAAVAAALGLSSLVLASEEEAEEGTDNEKYMSSLRVKQAILAQVPWEYTFAVSDETTPIQAGLAKLTFRMPKAVLLNANGVRASLNVAQSSGSIVTVDVNASGSTILSTKLTIDNGEKTSLTAATQPVISDLALGDDEEITIDIDQVGDGTAKGLKLTFIGKPA